jgi:hypothetical protein
MNWPLPSDYQTALQHPMSCLIDSNLKYAVTENDRLGFPKAISGNFAVVFPVSSNSFKWVVRCFAQPQKDRQERYAVISDYMKKHPSPYFPDFEYEKDGIRINGTVFPIIKMRWIEGELLDTYVKRNLRNPEVLKNLLLSFTAMYNNLQKLGIAHGDLQHRNILIIKNEIKLIDYDGMFVPGLEKYYSCEQGHPNYQSPLRTGSHFGPYLDNFSAWVIYLSILSLATDPSLWALNDNDDECIILKKSDYLSPDISLTLQKLEDIKNPNLQRVLLNFQNLLRLDVSDIPPLDPQRIPAPTPVRPKPAVEPWLESFPYPQQTTKTQGLPEWMYPKKVQPVIIQPQISNLPQVKLPRLKKQRLIYWASIIVLLTSLILSSIGLIPGFSPWLSLIVWLIFNICLFRFVYTHSDFFIEKRKMKQALIDIENQSYEIKERLQNLEQEIQSFLATNSNRLNILVSNWEKSNKQAITQVEKIKRNSDELLINLQNEKRSLNVDSEKQEIINTRMSEIVNEKLKTYSILDMNIYGFGEDLKKLLNLYGFYTAADIKDMAVDSSQITHIIRSDRIPMRIPGIGIQKATAFIRWKQGLEDNIRAQNKVSLSQNEIISIANKVKLKIDGVTSKELLARKDYEKNTKQIVLTCQKEHDEIRKQVMLLSREKSEFSGAMNVDWQALIRNQSKLNSENIQKQNTMAIFSTISFWDVIVRINLPLDDYRNEKFIQEFTNIMKDIRVGIKDSPSLLKELWGFITGRRKM